MTTGDFLPSKLTEFERPEQLLALIENERLRDVIGTLALDGEIIPGDTRPQWAVRAAQEFWRTAFSPPKSKKGASEPYRFGYLWGSIGRLQPQSLDMEPKLAAVLEPKALILLLHSTIADAPKHEAADFYAGYSDGLKNDQLAISPPCPIYLVFAVAWREVSALKNITQIHEWLAKLLGSNMTGSRERIAKICQKLRLPLADKGGRPKRKPRNRPAT